MLVAEARTLLAILRLQQSHDHGRVRASTCGDTPPTSFAGRSKKSRGLMCRSSSSRGSGFPAVGDPRPADEATDGDDGVGEVEERVDHLLPAFVAALQPVERVVPGIGALDVPTLAGQRWPA